MRTGLAPLGTKSKLPRLPWASMPCQRHTRPPDALRRFCWLWDYLTKWKASFDGEDRRTGAPTAWSSS